MVTANTPKRIQNANPRVIELGPMVIEGKVAKPTVFFVLGRSTARFEAMTNAEPRFLQRILDDAKKNPF